MKRFMLVFLVLMLLPVFSLAATLDPPWKCLIHNRTYEFWYDTSRVVKSASYIDAYVWEIFINDQSTKYRHMRFDRSTGQVGYGEAKGYKRNKLVADFDFSKSGFLFRKPGKEEKKLFKVVN